MPCPGRRRNSSPVDWFAIDTTSDTLPSYNYFVVFCFVLDNILCCYWYAWIIYWIVCYRNILCNGSFRYLNLPDPWFSRTRIKTNTRLLSTTQRTIERYNLKGPNRGRGSGQEKAKQVFIIINTQNTHPKSRADGNGDSHVSHPWLYLEDSQIFQQLKKSSHALNHALWNRRY